MLAREHVLLECNLMIPVSWLHGHSHLSNYQDSETLQRAGIVCNFTGWLWPAGCSDHVFCVTVLGGGGTALRDFVSDAVGNATQDANYKGLYLPFYTVGTGVGQNPSWAFRDYIQMHAVR